MNKLRAFFAVLLTVLTLSHSQPSQATVGKIIGNKKMATVGLAMTGTGAVIAIGGMAIVRATCVDMGCLAVLFPLFAGGVVGGLGLITLDGEQDLQFQALDKAAAKQIGVSEFERESFNLELDQANMLLTDVASELSQVKNSSPADSVQIWEEVKHLVSPETFTTMQKIVSQK